MTPITKDQVSIALQHFIDPYLQQDLVSAKAVREIYCENNRVKLDICLGYPAAGVKDQLIAAIQATLSSQGIVDTDITISCKIEPHTVATNINPLKNVKNIIAIASGKGGVGKSTTAVNLAMALQLEGARVGLLDADIYGPNQPLMLGVTDIPDIKQPEGLLPVIQHGLQTMSIGYLVHPNTPMIWRGPMVSQALQQLTFETLWDDLDYLIIDLPPGTGDIQLTLAQKIPVTGAVMITTPQVVAIADVRKGLEMLRKVKIPILGIIENMGLHRCSHCGHEEAIFGSGGAMQLAQDTECDLLGQLPLDSTIREQADEGYPSVIAQPGGKIAQTYREIARRTAGKIATMPKSFATKFPKIVVEAG